MNKRRSVAVLILLAFLVACASTPADRIAYTSINAAVDGAQTALKAWNEKFYAPGVQVDPVKWNGRRDQVQAAYVKFQNAARVATTVSQDLAMKDNATKIASDAAADLIAFIASLEK